MKISACYSHLNGLEFIKVHKPYIWEEIEKAILEVDSDSCRTKVSKELRTYDKMLYGPKSMNDKIGKNFKIHGWNEQRTSYWVTDDARLIRKTMHMPPTEQKSYMEANGIDPILSYNQTDFIKDRVAVEIQFGKYAFVAYDLFVKHMAFFVNDDIDVGVEILPMKELQKEMSSGPAYYEGELYNLIRQGRGIPAVPLVLVGIAP